MTFHPEILQGTQAQVLRQLAHCVSPRQFYLGGGTALAIYLGHRHSVDLDWFTPGNIPDPLRLAQELRDEDIPFITGGIERGTLHGIVETVRLSFMEYHYPLLEPAIFWPEFACPLASITDLACMKLSAVAQRGSHKDFIDIYALGINKLSLKEMLSFYQRKYSVKDISHVLYGLSYFDDAEREKSPILHLEMDWKVVKKSIQEWVREVAG
jgi:predicted nucleotidyltransferase component of viral defense system